MRERTEARLARIRGQVPPIRHTARTLAALTSNPGCTRRALLDAAGVDKAQLARRLGAPAGFGQSVFAITRGNAFEAHVKQDAGAQLARLVADALDRAEPRPAEAPPAEPRPAVYRDLTATDGKDQEARADRSATELLRAITEPGNHLILLDHPLLRLELAGASGYLEPDLVAVRPGGMCHIIEIKSFPIIDGQADGAKVAAAAVQAAVYVLALRRTLARTPTPVSAQVTAAGSAKVSAQVVLVCPENFANRPTAAVLDVRKHLIVLEHQFRRLTRIDTLLDELPDELTLDPAPDRAGRPTRPAAELHQALNHLSPRYQPDCLTRCELAYLCRAEAADRTATLGPQVREELGGVETVAEALALADGSQLAGDDLAEVAAMLRTTARIYHEASRVPAALAQR